MKEVHATVLDATHLELSEPLSAHPGDSVQVLIQDGAWVHDRGKASSELQGPLREREMVWCRDNSALLETYAGRWVVVEGEEIVGDGETLQQAVEQAATRGIEIPYVLYVEASSPDTVSIGI